jgi:hypothetical protein
MRFFVVKLFSYIEALLQYSSACLSPTILEWYTEAQYAAREYALIEDKLYPVFRQTKNRD